MMVDDNIIYERFVLFRDFFYNGYYYVNSERIHAHKLLPEIAEQLSVDYDPKELEKSLTELAKKITDKQLQDVFAEYKPECCSLTRCNEDFLGRYYTYINGSGNLEIKDSSEEVRNNAINAIQNLSDNGIQFLHSVVECYKKYKPEYGCRREELYKTMVELGYVPKNPSSKTMSALLGYKIVCKDKHSYWMSMETVPVVDEVLHKFLHGSDTETKNNFQETIDRGPIKVPDSIFDPIIGMTNIKSQYSEL